MPSRRPLAARTLLATALLLAAGLPRPATAGLRHTSALGVRNDRLGLGVFSDTAWRWRLFDSEHVLLRDTTLDVGVVSQLSPATLHPGVFVEVVPVAVLKLRASVQRLQYFGWFGGLSSYPDGDWSPPRLTESSREHSGDRAGGYLYDARATLRGKVWRIVFSLEGQRSVFDFEAPGPVHEPVSDLLVSPDEALTQVRATLGFVVHGEVQRPGSLMVAGLHQYFRTDDTDVVRHLPGLAVVAKPPTDWWSTGDPTLAVLGGVFAVDPYREGSPYIGSLLTMTFSEDP
jgi:hypothetical protein